MRHRIAALALMGCVSSADAAIIAYGFTGQVTGVGLPVFGLNPAVGTVVNGTFAYDTSAADFLSDLPDLGAYQQFPPYRLSVNIGGATAWSGAHVTISIYNDFGGNVEDFISIGSQPAVVEGIQRNSVLNLTFVSKSTAVFANDQLPTALNLADFDDSRSGHLINSENNERVIAFSIDTLTRLEVVPPDPGPGVSPVPEPLPWQLLALGLVVLGSFVRSPHRGLRRAGIVCGRGTPRG